MILKNLKTFLLHLRKNKLYTLITVVGFSISLMFVMLLSVYIQKENSNDQFHVNKDRIYRLVHEDYSGFAPPSGPALMDKFPEIECFTRTFKRGGFASVNSEDKFKIDYLMVDSTFFNMFSFELVKGNPETALHKNSIVLSESYAHKIFGEMPELGQLVHINGDMEYKLAGIMKDLPENTHFEKVDAFVDFPSLAIMWKSTDILTKFHNNSFGLYVMEKPNSNFAARAPDVLALFNEVNWMYKKGYAKEVVFEPLTDVYFGTSYSSGIKQGSKRLLQVLSAIVFMILFLSILNYSNLTIAQSANRSKEIAIKKLMGSRKKALLFQYTSESALITFFSYLIALGLCFMVEPVFNYLLNTQLELFNFISIQFILLSGIAAVLVGMFSGLVPAFTVSNFNPVEVVKGSFRMKSKATYSKILIAFQYLIIIVLVISALFIDKQTTFMRNYDLGYQKDNVLIMDNWIENNQRDAFKSKLEAIAGVEQVCYVLGTPIDGGNNNSFDYEGKSMSFQTFVVDTAYFRMMGMEVIKTGTAYAQNSVILNETAIRELGLPANPTSAKIYGKDRPIYGIVKDFHFRNLKQKVGPAYFTMLSPKEYAWSIMVKVGNKNTYNTAKKIESAYLDFTHGLPFEMKFMDDSVNQWYEREARVGQIVKYFTLLTIIISIMGLFAMSLYYVQQKTKEIGVRKVNGAKVSEVLVMLNKDFIRWVGIAFMVAVPIAYFAMQKWLENFAYKTTLSWWIFALAGVLAMGIALLTVSWQSWRAATRNPVEALRYE